MTELSANRHTRIYRASQIELAAAASDVYYQGAAVGFNTATGLLVVAQALTTFWGIGFVAEQKTLGAGGGTILVNLWRELHGIWVANDVTDTVVATDVGNLCYWLDDQTVKRDDDTNALSVAGRVWKVDSVKGVLVEPLYTAINRLTAIDS